MYSNDDYLLELLTEAGNVSPEEVGEAQASKGRRSALEYLVDTGRVLEGGKILTGLGELSLLHALSDVPVHESTLGVHKIELVVNS